MLESMNAGQNLASSSLCAIGIAEWIEDIGTRAEANRADLVRLHIVFDHQLPHRIHARMPKHATRVWLDRDAGSHDAVRISETSKDAVGFETATEAEDLEEAPWTIETVPPAGKPSGGQLRGRYPVFGGPSHVKRLGHRSKVHPNARG